MASTTPGNGAPPGDSSERTAEQLAAVYAAMMEELGVGRKDELPLADRNENVVVDTSVIKRRDVTAGPGASWHNIVFDDVNPADDDLDSIAEGQLYRLRNMALTGSSQISGGSGGRGGRADRGGRGGYRGRGDRGGFSQRGGRHSSGQEPAYNIPRGGHASPGRGFVPNRQPPPHLATFTQTFFNDARQGINARARVDNIIAGLRAGENGANRTRRNRKSKQQQSPAVNSGQGHLAAPRQVSNEPPARVFREPAAAMFSLASVNAFLTHAGLNSDEPRSSRPSGSSRSAIQPVATVNPTSAVHRPVSAVPEAETRGPQPNGQSSVRVHAPQVNSTVNPNNAHISQVQPIVHSTALDKKLPDSTLDAQQALSQSQQKVAKPQVEKPHVGLGGSRFANPPTPGPVPLVSHQVHRNDENRTPSEIASIQSQTPPVLHQRPPVINENENSFLTTKDLGPSGSQWGGNSIAKIKREHGVSVQKNKDANIRPGKARLLTYNPQDKFYTFELDVDGKVVVHELLDAAVCFTLEGGPQGRVIAFQAADKGQLSPVWNLLFKMPYMAKNFYDTARPTSISPLPLAAALSTASTTIGTSNTEQTSEQNDVVMSEETWQAPAREQSEMLVDFFGNDPENQSQTSESRISSQVFSSLVELEGVAPLISFSDHGDDDPEVGGAGSQVLSEAMIEMLSAGNTEQIREILEKLDSRPEGTFLQQLTAIVTKYGFPGASRLTAGELRDGKWATAYATASERVLSNFLSDSEIFKELPDFVSLMWVSNTSKKVLELAISQHRRLSIEELLSHRKNAYKVRVKLIDEEDLKYRAPAQSLSRPAGSALVAPHVPAPVPSVAPVTVEPALIKASQEWQNFQQEQTDMSRWDAILNNDRKPPPRTQSVSKTKGHVPSNSDYDRLAQTLEGFHMDREPVGNEQKSSISKSQNEPEHAVSNAIGTEAVPPPRPMSVASRASTSASQSMTEKLTSALTMPLTASPRIKTQISTLNTRMKMIEGQLSPAGTKTGDNSIVISKSTQGSMPAEEFSPSILSETSTVRNASTFVQNSIVVPQQYLLAAPPNAHAADPSRSTSPSSSLVVHVSPTVAHADHLPETAAATPTPSLPAPIAQPTKGHGLSASKWASAESTAGSATDSTAESTEQTHDRSSGAGRHRLSAANAPVFKPASQLRYDDNVHHDFQPSRIPLDFMSPPPMIPVQEGYVPLVATVITRDPHTGVFRETEGLLKAGSVPVLAHMPVSLMGPPRNQENIPTGFVPPAPASYQMPSFPARSDMHTRQPSESSGSEINLRSGFGSNPLSPLGLRGRNDPLTNIANIRRAFSPDHQEEMDMQAKLQSRLNSSLAARQASLSPAHK